MSKRSRKDEVIPFKPWMERGINCFKNFTDEEKENALRQLIAACGYQTRKKIATLTYNCIHLDVLASLPLEIFEYIVDYLPALDALLACHTSLIWNERISELNTSWRRKYMRLCLIGNPMEFQSQENWKAECERAVALTMKISDQTMVKHSTKFYVKLDHVSAMDYCDDIMVCCGSPVRKDDFWYEHSDGNVVQIYKRRMQTWDFLDSYSVPPDSYGRVYCCALVRGFQLVLGDSDGILTFWDIKLPVDSEADIAVQVRRVDAHTNFISSVCVDEDIGIVASAGYDERIHLWDLQTTAKLKSFRYLKYAPPPTVSMSLLSGEKSPFVGYSCFLFQKPGVDGTISAACWGKGIPLAQALFAADMCHTPDFGTQGYSSRRLVTNVFVQGGSIVYGFAPCDKEGFSKHKDRLIWQPIDPDDFMSFDVNVREEELQKFRTALHPWRENRYVELLRRTHEILGVGRCFSIVIRWDSESVWMIKNSTGDEDRLLTAERDFNSYFHMMCMKVGSTKFLDGFDHIEPESIIIMKQPSLSRVVYWAWKPDALTCKSPSETDLRAFMKKERSLLASTVTRPKKGDEDNIFWYQHEDWYEDW